VSHGTCSDIDVYINAVANIVMLSKSFLFSPTDALFICLEVH